MNINEIYQNIEYNDGIWFAKNKSSVSYPEQDNECCFAIEDNSFWFNHRNNCILAAVNNYKPDGFFMDIGGGNGFVSKMLQKNGYDVLLLEPGLNGCMNSKKRGIKNIICGALQDVVIKESSVPSIGIFDVLEHIEEDFEFLNNCNKALTVSGKLFITVPAFQFLWSNEDVNACHFRRYTIRNLEALLKKCHYRILFSTYFFAPLIIPIFVLRTIPSKTGFNNYNINNKNEKDHAIKDSISKKILNMLLKPEIKKIKNNKSIIIGTSCLIVAEKL